jgi:hypothetical protein
MPLEKSYFLPDLQEALYKNNDFLTDSVSHDAFFDGKYINVPQTNSSPNSVIVNPTSFPLTAVQRTDDNLVYAPDTIALVPQFVTDIESFQVAYPKRQSIMYNQYKTLGQVVGDKALYNWAKGNSGSNGTVIFTSSTTAVGTSLPTGATGTRKKFTANDLASAKQSLDKQNIPSGDRVAVISSDMMNDLLTDPAIQQYLSLGTITMIDGKLPKLYGFKIYERSSVLVYDKFGVIRDNTSSSFTTASTDCHGAIFYSASAVGRAQGNMDIEAIRQVALYLGDIIGGYVQFGSSALRKDGKGIVTIAQKWVS